MTNQEMSLDLSDLLNDIELQRKRVKSGNREIQIGATTGVVGGALLAVDIIIDSEILYYS